MDTGLTPDPLAAPVALKVAFFPNNPGAATLTPPTVHPGTPAYRAPESWLFDRQFFQDSTARYHAGPADDLYALGVTACRLLTGEYPELAAPTQDERGTWRPGTVMTPLALRNTAVVDPELHALVLRMLSMHPEQRGTAEELAQALEQAAEHSSSKSIQPLATRAPAKGRCPLKQQLALNGGCWGTLKLDKETCEGFGGVIFKKMCYLPILTIPRQRPPTSSPTDQR